MDKPSHRKQRTGIFAVIYFFIFLSLFAFPQENAQKRKVPFESSAQESLNISEKVWPHLPGRTVVITKKNNHQETYLFLGRSKGILWVSDQNGKISEIPGTNIKNLRIVFDAPKTRDLQETTDKNDDKNPVTTSEGGGLQQRDGVAIFFGLGPAILGGEYRRNDKLLFLSGSLAIPLLNEGTDWFFSAGFSKLHPIAGGQWIFETSLTPVAAFFSGAGLFGSGLNDETESSFSAAFGAGFTIGFRYIFENGIIFSARIPLLGYAADTASGFEKEGIVLFYGLGAVSLPMVTFGYRF